MVTVTATAMAMVITRMKKNRTNLSSWLLYLLFIVLGTLSSCRTKEQAVEFNRGDEVPIYLNDRISIDHNLLLDSGIYFTKPLNRNAIQLADKDYVIEGSNKQDVIIKRPDNSIPESGPRDFYSGMYFLPEAPNEKELSTVEWSKYINPETKESYQYTILSRGSITIKNLTVDCNMQGQGIQSGEKVEHNAMLRFQGLRHEIKEGKFKGRVAFVALNEVCIENVHFVNGGHADNIYVSRGYFMPNIRHCIFKHISEDKRINGKRATIGFSSPAANIEISNSDIYKIELEETHLAHWDDAPGDTGDPWTSNWRIEDCEMDLLDLAHKGSKVFVKGRDLRVRNACMLYQIGGHFQDCAFRIKDNRRRLNRLRGVTFDNVEWTIESPVGGHVRGMLLTGQYGQGFNASFINNNFKVEGSVSSGQIIDSEFSESPTQKIIARFIDCSFDDRFGTISNTAIANIYEKGNWTFKGVSKDHLRTNAKRELQDIKLIILND